MSTKILSVVCNICKETFHLEVSAVGYKAWQAGMLIQLALPELTPDQRELLISGTCGPCFDRIFRAEEEIQEWEGSQK